MNSLKVSLLILMFSIAGQATAQNIFVSKDQDLNFGDFYFSGDSGGIISISNEGNWSATGNAFVIESDYKPAAFSISTDSRIPVKVQIETPTATLSNPDGKDISLELNKPSTEFYTIQDGSPARVFIGGNLKIGTEAVSNPGNYRGSVSIRVTIVNE